MKAESTESARHDVTRMLLQWKDGDRAALDELLPLIYDELRRVADGYLRREHAGHTLQPTALVNEVFLQLIDQPQASWESRAHFFGVAARLMRQILIQHARAQHALKRGGEQQKFYLDEVADVAERRDLDLTALDDALGQLEEIAPRQCRIVELRYFGGLSIEETATALDISPATVKREWTMAKAWLHRQISRR